ncbi:MAG: glycoside hydrolase family 9 protein [Chitinispirillia bacterium]|nr:glycoside hydrolase family 9 protein [Chitinispirillia bacterium]
MSILKRIAGPVLCAGILTAALAQGQAPSLDVRLNTVGFIPGFPKKASIAIDDDCPDCAVPFTVRTVSGSEAVFSGFTGPSRINSDTKRRRRSGADPGEYLLTADFTDFSAPGRYYIEVDGIGRSANFRIGNDVFVEPFRAVMLGMYLWRCGAAVSASYNGESYSHAACHLNDASIKYINNAGVDNQRNATGGWHDAGDYNKYTVNSGVTVGLMLKAWEHFSHRIAEIPLTGVTGGAMPAYLTEVKWNLDWVAKMQYGTTNGRVAHKISTLGFGGDIMPEDEKTPRYFVPWSTAATGSFVAMLAQGARIYAPYDKATADGWLAKARVSYDLLMSSALVESEQFDVGFSTGGYATGGDADKRLWAAAEMWEATGEPQFLEYLEANMTGSSITNQVQWGNVNNLAALTYLTSSKPGRNQEVVDMMTQALERVAGSIVNAINGHGYGRALGNSNYYWGANGTIAGTAYMLNVAYMLTGETRYLFAVQDVLSHLLGRNWYGRSFVTGVGHNPPVYPHDRTSVAQKKPWPGRLVGGPHHKQNHNDAGEELKCPTNEAAMCWDDVPADYFTNEVAINWNGAMAYALTAAINAADQNVSISHRAVSRRSIPKAGIKTTRAVRMPGGKIDIPPGAKVYSLDGKLVAHRKAGDAMPVIRRNGVFIIRVDENNVKR